MTAELAEDLATRGHRVTIITGWPNHPTGILQAGWNAKWRSVEADARGFRVIRCGHSIHARTVLFWRIWYYATFAVSSFANGLVSGPIDSVLCLSTPIFGGWAAWLLARLKGAEFLYGIFDLFPESAANAGMMGRSMLFSALRATDTLLCRLSDAIVTLGPRLRAEIIERKIPPRLVHVVPLWLDGRKIKPGQQDNPWRREHAISPGTFVALYAGTIGHISGAETLVETARLLLDHPNILILCVGDGPVKDRLMAAAALAGVPNLRFLPFQSASVLNEMQATASVGLVTLLPGAGRTSLPSKVLGYFAAGRPVVAAVDSDSDTAKMILRGECGRVTACQDPAALAAAILELYNDPGTCVQMGQRARAYFEQFFDRGHCSLMYERLLSGVESAATDMIES